MLMKRGFSILAVVAIAMVGCGGNDSGGSTGTSTGATSTGATSTGATSTGATTVDVTEKDFAVAASPASASSGDISFSVTNDGPSVHEFVIFSTDLDPDALPTNDDGTVDEEGEGVTHIDEIEDIAVGSTATLDVTLDPGSYVFICNLPGHYAAGMHTSFTVS
jgi:uncharacterized cupredoxin-like copper-binding protein